MIHIASILVKETASMFFVAFVWVFHYLNGHALISIAEMIICLQIDRCAYILHQVPSFLLCIPFCVLSTDRYISINKAFHFFSFHLFISPRFKNAHSAQLILKGAVNTNI